MQISIRIDSDSKRVGFWFHIFPISGIQISNPFSVIHFSNGQGFWIQISAYRALKLVVRPYI